jgi:hypothetical protein
VADPSRNHEPERFRVLWVLDEQRRSGCHSSCCDGLNAYEIQTILGDSTRNQVATRLGDLRWWQPDTMPPEFLAAAVLLDGSIHRPRHSRDGIRYRRDFHCHPTEDGWGAVHVILLEGVKTLERLGWAYSPA